MHRALAVVALASAASLGARFQVQELAPGVRLFTASGAGVVPTNSLVVERKDGLLVVDAQPTPAAGKALLAAIAKSSDKPVRYLVLTHPHADAAGGWSAFPASTLVVASGRARDRLADPAYDFGAEARARAADPAAWVEPPRPVPVLLSEGPFVLDDPDRRVEIFPLPRAHSEGNLWVRIPQAGLLAVGDIVVADRNPYAGDASIEQWIGALNDLVRLENVRIVPLVGPAMAPEDARGMRDAFAWLRGRIVKGFIDLNPREEIVSRALADPAAAKWFDLSAKPAFVPGVFERVYQEVLEERRKRGNP